MWYGIVPRKNPSVELLSNFLTKNLQLEDGLEDGLLDFKADHDRIFVVEVIETATIGELHNHLSRSL